MPIHRWIARAAGGTSQRLKRTPAMVRSRASMPTPFGVVIAVSVMGLPPRQTLVYCGERRRCGTIAGAAGAVHLAGRLGLVAMPKGVGNASLKPTESWRDMRP